jgi:diguanylate cyclase (GGDEF)-like protein/PAS domain S-box-containing protein
MQSGDRQAAPEASGGPIDGQLLKQLRAAMDASPDLFYIVDMEAMRFLYVNETACRMEGLSREEHLEFPPWEAERISREQLAAVYAQAKSKPGESITSEILVSSLDGRRGWFEVQRKALHVEDRWLMVAVTREVTARKLAEEAALRQGRMYATLGATNEAIMRARSPEELYRQVCDAGVHGGMISAAVLEPDASNEWVQVAAAGGELSRPLARELVATAIRSGRPCVSNDFLQEERTQPWHAAAAQSGVKAGAAIPFARNGRPAGALVLFSGRKRAFDEDVVRLLQRMADNLVFALDNFGHDAERREAEARAQHLATHDGLTGLPNRLMFSELLNHAIDSGRRYGRRFALLFVDLDRFKSINDSLGHHTGDAVLRAVAERVRNALRASDAVARLGGDEFVVLLQEVADGAAVSSAAQKILDAVTAPMTIEAREIRITASIGASIFPSDGQDERTLMKCADRAMYLAKEQGSNRFRLS